ncbi:RHG18 protein, partial [Polypterus senegalus]
MISQESLSPPSIGRSISQESLDSNSMEDYWSEVKSIEEGADNTQEDQVFEVKSVDESEQDEAWLNETGLSMLVSGVPEKDCAEALLSTLTRKQAAVVQKRLDNYTQTLRMKYKQPVRDVRDIFSGGDSPKFTVRKARLGCTIIRDLSPQDMKKIACLSLIELTAYYDALGIELKRNRAVRVKARETGLFGVPLSTLIENDQKKFPGSTVPQIFKKNLRQELEAKFYDDTFNWDQVRHNDAAGLLKLFIRELPYPLLTVEYLPAFAAVDYISSPRLQLHALHLLIMLLPEAHRNTLKQREIPEGVIRVHAPLHAKVSMAIQLDSETKAKDVVARFDCENSYPERGGKIPDEATRMSNSDNSQPLGRTCGSSLLAQRVERSGPSGRTLTITVW